MRASLKIRIIITVAGIALASGCASLSARYPVPPSVTTEFIVQINQHFEIPNRKARVYIQEGAEIKMRDIYKWNTYCSVLMQDLHKAGESKLTVSPGQFEIIKVRKYDDTYFPGSSGSLGGITFERPTNVIFEVEMRLKSAEQPGVRALICAKRVDDYGLHHPTLAEIRIALGNVIEIKALQ
jgi:hypothetical protein